jgi:hypothetical protein
LELWATGIAACGLRLERDAVYVFLWQFSRVTQWWRLQQISEARTFVKWLLWMAIPMQAESIERGVFCQQPY